MRLFRLDTPTWQQLFPNCKNSLINTCPAARSGGTLETDCPTYTWRPSSDGDWQDFYDGEFFGFQGVFTTSAAGNLTESLYYSTEGLINGCTLAISPSIMSSN